MRFQVPFVFLAAGAVVQAAFGGPDAPSGAELKSVAMNGNGCARGGNATWNTTAEGALQLTTPGFKAISGKDVPRTDNRRYCQANMAVYYPDGWQFAVKRAGITGYEYLIAGVSGSVSGLFFFSGKHDDNSFGVNVIGEMQNKYTTDYEAPEDVSWSHTGGKDDLLNVKVEARFGQGSDSTLSSISEDGFNTRVQWRKC